MRIIGLTGNVGCGKSTVGRIMKDNFLLKLVMTDELGHLAMQKGTTSYSRIVSAFGEDILTSDGEIDRTILGKIVFENGNKLKDLNQIIHPWVKKKLQEDIEYEKNNNQYKYYVVESAILFESGLHKICHENWYVDTEESIRRKRLKTNRGYTDEKIDAILENQKNSDFFTENCEVIIYNNGDMCALECQLKKLLE